VNALQLHWWIAISEMLFVMTLVLLHFHCIVLYSGFVDATLLFGFHTADLAMFPFACDSWLHQ